MLPAERPDVGEESVVDGVTMVADELDGALEVAAVPQHDGGDQQVEAAGAVVLVLVRAVADLAQAVEEDGVGERVAGLPLVEAVLRATAKLGAPQPVEDEEHALDPADLAQPGGEPALPREGRQLLEDVRGGDVPARRGGDEPP